MIYIIFRPDDATGEALSHFGSEIATYFSDLTSLSFEFFG